MEKLLIEIVKPLSDSIKHFIETGAKSVKEYEIDTSDLSEIYLTKNIRESSKYEYMFNELTEIEKSPCIYCFEITSTFDSETIINKVKEFSKNSHKITPAIKSNYPKNSNILYIGKVNGCIWGRLITHLGFHTHKNGGNPTPSLTHGLQLFYWAKDLSLVLKFKVIEFEPSMKDLMKVLESKLAEEMQPIIGKHN